MSERKDDFLYTRFDRKWTEAIEIIYSRGSSKDIYIYFSMKIGFKLNFVASKISI